MGRLTHQLTNEDPDRLSRVLDAKYRCIGIDVNTLKQQVSERKAGEAFEKQLDLEWGRIQSHYDKQLRLADQNATSKRIETVKGDHDFRQDYQLKHTRREWDLNRPDAKRLDRPAREGDDDERCGISSMQRFDGEDLSAATRKSEQVEQCDRWWAHQSAELQAARDAASLEKQQLGDLTRFYDSVQQSVMGDEKHMSRMDKQNLANTNSDLAAARNAARQAELARQQALNEHEIACALTNPVLCEDPAQAKSWASDGRVRKDHWKGMTPEEKKSILDTQMIQVEESKRRRQCERAREAEWARMALHTDKSIKEQQRQADLFKKQQALNRREFLKAQEQEKIARDEKMNQVYANAVTGIKLVQAHPGISTMIGNQLRHVAQYAAETTLTARTITMQRAGQLWLIN